MSMDDRVEKSPGPSCPALSFHRVTVLEAGERVVAGLSMDEKTSRSIDRFPLLPESAASFYRGGGTSGGPARETGVMTKIRIRADGEDVEAIRPAFGREGDGIPEKAPRGRRPRGPGPGSIPLPWREGLSPRVPPGRSGRLLCLWRGRDRCNPH